MKIFLMGHKFSKFFTIFHIINKADNILENTYIFDLIDNVEYVVYALYSRVILASYLNRILDHKVDPFSSNLIIKIIIFYVPSLTQNFEKFLFRRIIIYIIFLWWFRVVLRQGIRWIPNLIFCSTVSSWNRDVPSDVPPLWFGKLIRKTRKENILNFSFLWVYVH